MDEKTEALASTILQAWATRTRGLSEIEAAEMAARAVLELPTIAPNPDQPELFELTP